MIVKVSYLLLYSITLRTLLLLPIGFKTANLPIIT